jgi:transcription initiation factor TFIID subunit 11
MTEAQLDRYEAFRRSSLKKPVQKLVQALTGTSIKSQDKSLIALSSIAKTFIGQLIESAVEIATERGEAGKPLEPTHIIAAYERLKQEEGVSVNRKRLRL